MPERAEKRKRISIAIILVAAFALILCVGVVIGGAVIYGVSQVTDLFSREAPHVALDLGGDLSVEPSVRVFTAAAIVTEVTPGSPADDAGIQPGDVIGAVNGQEIGPDASLADLIGQHEPGDQVTLEIQRPGEGTRQVRVKLGEHPDKAGVAYLGVTYSSSPAFLGRIEGMPPLEHLEEILPFGQLDEFDLPRGRNLQGVIVLQVTEDSPAAVAGIVRGDLITAVDGEAVDDPDALAAAIGQHRPGDRVTLTIYSLQDQEKREITVTLVENPDQAGKGYLGVFIGGALHMDGFGEGQNRRGFRFYFRDDGSSGQNQDRLPFSLDRLPINPGQFPFDLDQWPFEFDEGFRQFEFRGPMSGDTT
jgi:membrane-associated protease RseP (regulator of RpoE activity)